MNNLPVDAMRDLGRGPVIGCDVGADRAFTTDTDEVDVPLPWQLMRWMREKSTAPTSSRSSGAPAWSTATP